MQHAGKNQVVRVDGGAGHLADAVHLAHAIADDLELASDPLVDFLIIGCQLSLLFAQFLGPHDVLEIRNYETTKLRVLRNYEITKLRSYEITRLRNYEP